jgi:hypothetical protein
MSLVEKYVEALETLTGTPFQDAVCTRLRSAIPSFQKIPDKGGDGGLDGYSHNGENGYCCYGLELDAAKSEDDYVSMIVEKFQKDLRRLFELQEPSEKNGEAQASTASSVASSSQDGGKAKKPKFQHVPNKELASVLGKDVKIKHVRLLVNRYESKKVLGRLQTAFRRYKSESQCRFVHPDATLVLDGPQQLAEEHHIDELALSLARRQMLFERLADSASKVDLPMSSTFDSKMSLLKQIRPGHDVAIDSMAEDFKTDWRLALASEKDLSDSATNLHLALERGKRRLLSKVNKLMTESDEPWNEISTAGELAEKMLGPILESWFGDLTTDVCNGEVAALIGDCPIGWERRSVPDA